MLHNRNDSDQRISVKHFKWNFGGMFLFLAIFFFWPNLNILCLIIGFLCIFCEYLIRILNARLSECHRLTAGGAVTQASAFRTSSPDEQNTTAKQHEKSSDTFKNYIKCLHHSEKMCWMWLINHGIALNWCRSMFFVQNIFCKEKIVRAFMNYIKVINSSH